MTTLRLAASPVTASVAVNPAIAGLTVPMSFAGISFEVSYLITDGPLNDNASLKAILGVLNKNCSLRFGGNTSDTQIPTTANVQSAAQFAQAVSNGPLFWGVAYKVILPNATVADQAAANVSVINALVGVFGISNLFVQIGNEPNFYSGITFSAYQTNWQTYANAIVAAQPTVRFAGPDGGSTLKTRDNFIVQAALNMGAQLSALTTHNYANSRTSSNPGDLVSDLYGLFSDQQNIVIARGTPQLVPVAASGLPLYHTEGGTITAASEGVTLGAGLWTLREMILFAAAGWKGVHFHNNGTSGYSPVLSDGHGGYTANSSLYAMVLFNYLAGGQIIRASGLRDDFLIGALMPDGKIRVLVLNSDLSSPLPVNVANSWNWSAADVMYMTADSFDATNISIGGAQIGVNGSFSPVVASLPRQGDGTVAVTVPAASAALVTFYP